MNRISDSGVSKCYYHRVQSIKRRAFVCASLRFREALHPALQQAPDRIGTPEAQTVADCAEEAARLRAKHNLRTPDCVQIATAITAGRPVS
jgi:predicted nucleic acid-binding protein